MRFEDLRVAVSVADIARALSLDQQQLYRTIEGLLKAMRTSMRPKGVSANDIEELFADEHTLGLRDKPATGFSRTDAGSPSGEEKGAASANPVISPRSSVYQHGVRWRRFSTIAFRDARSRDDDGAPDLRVNVLREIFSNDPDEASGNGVDVVADPR